MVLLYHFWQYRAYFSVRYCLKIYLTPTENRIVIQSLNNLRNAMLKENRDTGCIDELLLKVMCAPVKKV